MLNILNLWFFFFFTGSISLIFNYIHLLNSLLSLEFISLSLYSFMCYYLMMMNMELFFLMYLLVMMVAEAVIGLVLLILIVCLYSNDNLFMINNILC